MKFACTVRMATPSDVDRVADMHTASWLSAYRGLLPDSYLDNNLAGERRQYWRNKFPTLTEREFVLIAEHDGEMIGFISLLDVPHNGYEALIDNLHVRPDLKGKGVGSILMKEVAERLLQSGRKNVYLFVLKGNDAAGKFYLSRHGQVAETSDAILAGLPIQHTKYVWDDLSDLL